MFVPVDDTIVEDNELFTFQTAAANSLDYIVGEDSIFQLTLFDNDGKIILTINVWKQLLLIIFSIVYL